MPIISSKVNSDVSVVIETNFNWSDYDAFFQEKFTSFLGKDIKEYIFEVIEERFKKGVGINNEVWPNKRTDGSPSNLTKTKKLKESFEFVLVGDSLTIFTTVPYAKLHNFGATYKTTIKQAHFLWATVFKNTRYGRPPKMPYNIIVPKRQFIGFDDNMITGIENKIYAYAKKFEALPHS